MFNNHKETEKYLNLISLHTFETRFEYAKQNTSLPDTQDIKAINELKTMINEMVIKIE